MSLLNYDQSSWYLPQLMKLGVVVADKLPQVVAGAAGARVEKT